MEIPDGNEVSGLTFGEGYRPSLLSSSMVSSTPEGDDAWTSKDLVQILCWLIQSILSCSGQPNVPRPQHLIPLSIWIGANVDRPLTEHDLNWWSSPQIELVGFYARNPLPNLPTEIGSTTFLIRRLDGRITGSGSDGPGPFTIEGKYDGPRVIFTKRYPTWQWDYSGLLFPWGLAGVWGQRDGGQPQGSFWVWTNTQ